MRRSAAILVLSAWLCVPALSGQTSPAAHAQPLGVPLIYLIGFGDQYLGGDELYDAKITVLQVVRGEKAWEIVKGASSSNKLPGAGFEYLLARIRFEFSARTSPSHYRYTIEEGQFTATGSDGNEYEAASPAEPPKPRLSGTLAPGSALEGWIAFQVPRSADKPLMIFQEDVGSVIHRGGGAWFRLYEGSAARR
ncbi:MAG TPA: DUF4352 domain-containing protein [Candidatus Acidoferrales bacterium]|nr:DUF4352 domain-containing protein [Candidatus Acidoferrales bacterium]